MKVMRKKLIMQCINFQLLYSKNQKKNIYLKKAIKTLKYANKFEALNIENFLNEIKTC